MFQTVGQCIAGFTSHIVFFARQFNVIDRPIHEGLNHLLGWKGLCLPLVLYFTGSEKVGCRDPDLLFRLGETHLVTLCFGLVVKSSSSLDHFAVLCYLNVNRPKTIHKSVNFELLEIYQCLITEMM